MKKMVTAATCAAALIWAVMVGVLALNTLLLPDSFSAPDSAAFSVADGLFTVRTASEKVSSAAAVGTGGSYNASVYLLDVLPVKTVRVSVEGRQRVIPGGTAFGAKMFSAGVLVVGFSDVETESGRYNPAKRAGLELGDIILTVGGTEVATNEDVGECISSSGGEQLLVVYTRDGVRAAAVLTPALASDGSYCAGMWVRDSTAGIGTLTYYDPATNMVAGLGHGITDSDTGVTMPVADGQLCRVEVTGVKKAVTGAPGELIGVFKGTEFAELLANCETGVYGRLTGDCGISGSAVEIAFRQEVHTGRASVLCSVSGELRSYAIEIESVDLTSSTPTKNMVIHVTDPELISLTGGIVQGMSGSPILQDGRLVGAVTHVFVNDPSRGYGIFAENMLSRETELS